MDCLRSANNLLVPDKEQKSEDSLELGLFAFPEHSCQKSALIFSGTGAKSLPTGRKQAAFEVGGPS
jgi:hypothetical protein